MNSSEFDQRFDEGESVLEVLDLTGARRRRLELRSPPDVLEDAEIMKAP